MTYFKKLRSWLLLVGFGCSALVLNAQRVGIKTNALYWGGATPNLGVELRLSRHFTLNLEGGFNPLSVKNYKFQIAGFQPEVRYWFSGRPQARHFVGLMALGSVYDIHDKRADYRLHHDGDAYGGGLTYGYALPLGEHWSMEATVGLGLLHYREKKYHDWEESPSSANNTKTMFAPLKLGLTFTYIIK